MKKTILLGLCALSLASCDREKAAPPKPKTLTEATQVGANTASCLINGQLWVADTRKITNNYTGDVTKASLFINYTTNAPTAEVNIRLRDNVDNLNSSINIAFYIENFKLNQYYEIPKESRKSFGGMLYFDNNGDAYSSKPLDYIGRVKITRLDVTNKIISGNFDFKAINDKGAVINVTEGRFDKQFDF
jgi:hypothetical protein